MVRFPEKCLLILGIFWFLFGLLFSTEVSVSMLYALSRYQPCSTELSMIVNIVRVTFRSWEVQQSLNNQASNNTDECASFNPVIIRPLLVFYLNCKLHNMISPKWKCTFLQLFWLRTLKSKSPSHTPTIRPQEKQKFKRVHGSFPPTRFSTQSASPPDSIRSSANVWRRQ